MLTKDIAKAIVQHVSVIDRFDPTAPLINITHSKSKSLEDVKICDFRIKISGTNNPLKFDHTSCDTVSFDIPFNKCG